jgi:hypothetical protein
MSLFPGQQAYKYDRHNGKYDNSKSLLLCSIGFFDTDLSLLQIQKVVELVM